MSQVTADYDLAGLCGTQTAVEVTADCDLAGLLCMS